MYSVSPRYARNIHSVRCIFPFFSSVPLLFRLRVPRRLRGFPRILYSICLIPYRDAAEKTLAFSASIRDYSVKSFGFICFEELCRVAGQVSVRFHDVRLVEDERVLHHTLVGGPGSLTYSSNYVTEPSARTAGTCHSLPVETATEGCIHLEDSPAALLSMLWRLRQSDTIFKLEGRVLTGFSAKARSQTFCHLDGILGLRVFCVPDCSGGCGGRFPVSGFRARR